MAAILYGSLSNPIWGTTCETALGIIVTNLTETTTREINELSDCDGDIQHIALYGQKSEFTCDFKVSATGFPDRDLVGSTVVLTDTEMGGTYIVTEVENNKAQNDWMGGSMKLVVYPEWVPGASSTTEG
jgi:hypothetical protein